MSKRTVGVQLIIFGKRSAEDLEGVLDDVAAAGYQAVETGFLGERVSGAEFRRMLDDRGLRHVGAHVGGGKLANVDAMIDWLAETGGRDLPLSDNRLVDQPLDAYRKAAEEYMAAAEKCNAAGITVSYHNHSWEFKACDGRLPIEVLYEACDPEMVQACVDVYWVRDGGVDPAAFVAKHADRIRILHAKDSYLEEVGRRSFTSVGSGVLDFPAIMKALEPSECPWVVVEQDTPEPGGDAAKSSAASRRYLGETFSI